MKLWASDKQLLHKDFAFALSVKHSLYNVKSIAPQPEVFRMAAFQWNYAS